MIAAGVSDFRCVVSTCPTAAAGSSAVTSKFAALPSFWSCGASFPFILASSSVICIQDLSSSVALSTPFSWCIDSYTVFACVFGAELYLSLFRHVGYRFRVWWSGEINLWDVIFHSWKIKNLRLEINASHATPLLLHSVVYAISNDVIAFSPTVQSVPCWDSDCPWPVLSNLSFKDLLVSLTEFSPR